MKQRAVYRVPYALRRRHYLSACLDAGTTPTEDGYWAWREVIARTSGTLPVDLVARLTGTEVWHAPSPRTAPFFNDDSRPIED